MLDKIVQSFCSKLLDMLADYARSGITAMTTSELTVKTLAKDLKALSARASDVEMEVKIKERYGRKKRKQEVEIWLKEVQELEDEFAKMEDDVESEGFFERFLSSGLAKTLSGRVEKLVEQSRHFGALLLDVPKSEGLMFLTRKLVGENFEQNLEKIWKLLVEDKVKSIGIHGMGGSGKTTLAKHLHNRFVTRTQLVIWITVSQTFSILNLQREIARAMHLKLSHKDLDMRAAKLKQSLSEKKNFVIIFDDVWENINMTKVGDPLSLDGCRLIITTRSRDVCHQVGCQQVVRVETLSDDESWDLFRETLGEEKILTFQVQKIAKRMVRKCGGLPLGIITTAGSMKGEKGIHEWRNALRELDELIMSEDGDEEDVFKILKYSFDQLGRGREKINGYTKLQLCFLYCSLYPEDERIERCDLIQRLIYEGLLDKKRRRSEQFDQGHSILDHMVKVCILDEVVGYDNIKYVKMHDLVRTMALKITKNKYLRRDGHFRLLEGFLDENENRTKDLEKISLMENNIRDISDGWSPNCPNLSTLLLQKNSDLKLIPTSLFMELHGLRVLNLSKTGIKVLPESLSMLVGLQALILSYCYDLGVLPNLGNLKELKELDLNFTCIEELPQGIEDLVNLECLFLDINTLMELPSNLFPNYPKLRCLYLPIHIEAPAKAIGKLKQLEEFKGRVKDIFDFGQSMGYQPWFKDYDRFYSVLVSGDSGHREDARWRGREKLGVRGMREVKVTTKLDKERWGDDDITLTTDVERLTLEKCEGSRCFTEDLQQTIDIKSLKYLRIDGWKGMECISKLGESQFRNLEEMRLWGLPDLVEMVIFERGGLVVPSSPFPCLKRMYIMLCKNLKRFGSAAWGLQNLEELRITSCKEMTELIYIQEGDGIEDGEGNQAPLIVQLPRLKVLVLWNLPRLKNICKARMVCTSIEYIHIVGCCGVKKLPIVFGQPNYDSPPFALRRICLQPGEEEWWESLELEHPSLHHLLQPFLFGKFS